MCPLWEGTYRQTYQTKSRARKGSVRRRGSCLPMIRQHGDELPRPYTESWGGSQSGYWSLKCLGWWNTQPAVSLLWKVWMLKQPRKWELLLIQCGHITCAMSFLTSMCWPTYPACKVISQILSQLKYLPTGRQGESPVNTVSFTIMVSSGTEKDKCDASIFKINLLHLCNAIVD